MENNTHHLEQLDQIKLKIESIKKDREILSQQVSYQIIEYINEIRSLTKSLVDTSLNNEQTAMIRLINMYANQLKRFIK
ncbi:hypothetical protein [Pedobacter sp.]|jgi:hypothetical protein|uniref:hypothetical protein n=1 Tax=Pedobacter sp. TaxID=1411316 RepID=UPI002CC8E086|nr:hypothetical protein [Pedobacter sp.]HWW41524.1 hypothetical protein [Pedobacter sp.]